MPSEGLCVSLLVLEAAHAFSLVPLRRALSLEWEGVDCFHFLKLLLLSLPNQQSCFARVAEMKPILMVNCDDIPYFWWLFSALYIPGVETGLKLLTKALKLQAECQRPRVLGPHWRGRLWKLLVRTVLDAHTSMSSRESHFQKTWVFFQLRQNLYCHEAFKRKLSTCLLPHIHMGYNALNLGNLVVRGQPGEIQAEAE